MTFHGLTRYFSGVLVPLAALRSDQGIGVGEFADLPLLGEWCSEVGLDCIQLLPVNDTGWQSSPYNALSAFALHPLYLCIADLPDLAALSPSAQEEVQAELSQLSRQYRERLRLDYSSLLESKTAILETVFERLGSDQEVRREIDRFAEGNGWVSDYSVFKVLKKLNGGARWREWSRHRDPQPDVATSVADDPLILQEARFHTWTQMRLEEQFEAAVNQLVGIDIWLKGDLPILVNEDSADVWANRSIFRLDLSVGAPPDGANPTGQNWGFPAYDWSSQEENGYAWWSARLRQAAKFYHAYRIDHVLGFFRAWTIPADDISGARGRFRPAAPISVAELRAAGLDDGRIRWLAEPHLSGEAVRSALGDEAMRAVDTVLTQVGDQDLFVFSPAMESERSIDTLDFSDDTRAWLLGRFRDRALVKAGDDEYVPTWDPSACSRYRSLNDDERQAFQQLRDRHGAASAEMWEDQGRRLLSRFRGSTDMLPCAEDLGAIPESVPRVLEELKILGLRIPRWARLWETKGQPFIPPAEYPFMTVCAPSIHDTSTLRGWWAECDALDGFWRSLGLSGDPPEDYTSKVAKRVVARLLDSGSAICMFQLQDLLFLGHGYVHQDPDDERINVPGTVSDRNWTFRVIPDIETLIQDKTLISLLHRMIERRRARAVGPAKEDQQTRPDDRGENG
jgi:4-alpha-glucanotransferase